MNEVYSFTHGEPKDAFTIEGEFSPASGWEACFFIMPDQATLSAHPANEFSDWLADSGIAFVVKIEPSAERVENFNRSDDPRRVEVDIFPPSGTHYIYENGKTTPKNLAELVQARRDKGWNVDQKLLRLLKLTTTE